MLMFVVLANGDVCEEESDISDSAGRPIKSQSHLPTILPDARQAVQHFFNACSWEIGFSFRLREKCGQSSGCSTLNEVKLITFSARDKRGIKEVGNE